MSNSIFAGWENTVSKEKLRLALQVLFFEEVCNHSDRVRVHGIGRKDQVIILGDEYPAAQKGSLAFVGIGGAGDKVRQFRIVDGKRTSGLPGFGYLGVCRKSITDTPGAIARLNKATLSPLGHG